LKGKKKVVKYERLIRYGKNNAIFFSHAPEGVSGFDTAGCGGSGKLKCGFRRLVIICSDF